MGATSYSVLHSAVYRLKDIVQGTGIYSHLAKLRNEQYYSTDKLEKLQAERLRMLLRHAQAHSPYYREIFNKGRVSISDDFGLGRLAEIPLLRRGNLQANLKNLICDDAQNPIPNSSGGSTGNPVNFCQDERYINYGRAANLLFTEWMGIRSGDKTAVFWGADRDFKEQSAREKTWARFDRVVALNSFAMSQAEILKFLERLNKLKPRYIQGYAGSLYLVAKIVNESYPLTFTPAAIRSAAEMLYDFQRQEIEKAFNSRVFNFYGSREVNNLATECSAHEGLHIFSSGRVVEIVDDNGKPVPDGIAGQIAVTDLTNFAFPFIRYLNGDIAVRSPKPCSCGRGYPLLEKIQGRTSDMIVIDGQYIHGEYFTHLFYKKPDIKQFQVIQEKDGTLRILVVSYNPEAGISDIVTKIREKVGSNVRISVEYVDRIAPTDSGKYRFTISRLDKSASKRVPDG